MEIKGVIFDMDGLMFDTERIAVRAWRQVGRELGMDLTTGLESAVGANASASAALFRQRFGPGFDYPQAREKCRTYMHQWIDRHGLPVKKGLYELLDVLKERGLKLSLATSSDQTVARRFLELAGVAGSFDRMVCGDMVCSSKPNPEIFLTAARLMGTAPRQTMVLEDSFNGIQAAAAGGFVACMVPDLRQPDETLLPLLDYKCDSLLDVVGVIDRMQQPETGS